MSNRSTSTKQNELRVRLLKNILVKKEQEFLRGRTVEDLLRMVNMFSAVNTPVSKENKPYPDESVQSPQQSNCQKRKYQEALNSPSKYPRKHLN